MANSYNGSTKKSRISKSQTLQYYYFEVLFFHEKEETKTIVVGKKFPAK